MSFQDSDITAGWEEILGKDKYRLILTEIVDNYPETRSIYVTYEDLDTYNTDFAMYVLENPDLCIKLGGVAIKASMPPHWDVKNKVNLRITGLPRDAMVDIRNLRAKHLGKLVAVEGLVRKATTVKPRMTYAVFRCARCDSIQEVKQTSSIMKEPLMCSNPDGSCNKLAMRFIIDDKNSKYTDTQKIEIQESPEGLRGGAQPERLTGFTEDDISGIMTVGNRIILNGIVRSVEKPERDKTTVFEMYMEIISVEFEQYEYDEIEITEEDELMILEMSQDPNIYENIVASISPTIYGMDEVKRAIALQLFGGCFKKMDDGTTIRGDMHILLIGDPGVAKSQILRYMSELSPRGIYASGKSASAAGLTAAAVKDDFGDGRWTLEAGALVLADKGLACIDELDKMTTQDRSSLHEAMESQKISVAKAGITATLQCRCSMLAAANPKYGRFETEGSSMAAQIDLPPALMSRFDMIFVLTDKPNATKDKELTSHILKVHRRGEAMQIPEETIIVGVDINKIKEDSLNIRPYYDLELLRKYVAYSKRTTPVMSDIAVHLIQESYLRIRSMGGGSNDSVPITPRQLEAFVRLAEASARLRLNNVVEEVDAIRAINLVEYYLGRIAAPDGGQWDIDRMSSKFTKKDRDHLGIINNIIDMFGSDEGVSESEIILHAMNEGLNVNEVSKTLKTLRDNGTLFSPSDGIFKRV